MAKNLLFIILITGLLAAFLDALGAIIILKANPEKLFRFIAAGAFGMKEAFNGGSVMIIAGIFFHLLIALTWTTIYFLSFKKIFARLNIVLAVILYGLIIWLGMNLIVVPLSEIPASKFDFVKMLVGFAIITVAVSLPICLMAKHFFKHRIRISN